MIHILKSGENIYGNSFSILKSFILQCPNRILTQMLKTENSNQKNPSQESTRNLKILPKHREIKKKKLGILCA